MRDSLSIRISEVEHVLQLKETYEVVTLDDSYWIFSHNESHHADEDQLDADALQLLMQHMPYFRAEAHIPLSCVTEDVPYRYEWGNSTRRSDYELLSEEEQSHLTLVPARRYLLHSCTTHSNDDRTVLRDVLRDMARYAEENGLQVEGDFAVIHMLPGKREGSTFVYLQFLCYLPLR